MLGAYPAVCCSAGSHMYSSGVPILWGDEFIFGVAALLASARQCGAGRGGDIMRSGPWFVVFLVLWLHRLDR